jgi:flagellar hook assembly protein FlgD
VTGRLVRTLADRSFAAGEYDLSWDGSDDSGSQVARGVYFARVEYAAKGVVGTGRVVVLR